MGKGHGEGSRFSEYIGTDSNLGVSLLLFTIKNNVNYYNNTSIIYQCLNLLPL